MVLTHWHVFVVDRAEEHGRKFAIRNSWLISSNILLSMSVQSSLYQLAQSGVESAESINMLLSSLATSKDLVHKVWSIVLHVVFNCLKH